MRLSTANRLTLSNAGIIVLCFLVLLVLVMWRSNSFMRGHIEEGVDAEVAMLASELGIDGRSGLTHLIEDRVRHHARAQERYYLLESERGERLAGNMAAWPAVARGTPGRLSLPSIRHPNKTHMVGSWTSLPDGSRLIVAFDEDELHHVQRKLRQGATWSLLVVLVMSWFAGRFITRTALRPIETIRQSARQIMQGDLSHRIPEYGSGDEFDQLARTLNDMLDRIEQLIAGVEGATDNIAHDLRSPLARVRARLEAAQKDMPANTDWESWVEKHLADIDQILSTFQSLLKIARVDSGILRSAFARIDMAALCRDAADFMEPLAESHDQRLVLQVPDSLLIDGHRDLLFQLLINLLDNAIKYGAPDTDIVLSCSQVDGRCVLVVRDHGPGIAAAQRERVFERLYRLDSTRMTPGLGLGLSLVRAVIHLHEGRIALRDASPGLQVDILLPLPGRDGVSSVA